MIFRARPNKLITDKGKLKYLELIKTASVGDKLKDIPNSKFKIKTDHIILAIGQRQEFMASKNKNVFFAGDYKLGATTLINAIGHAKEVARNVDHYLMRRNILKEKYYIESSVSTKRSLKDNYIPITDMRLRDLIKKNIYLRSGAWL